MNFCIKKHEKFSKKTADFLEILWVKINFFGRILTYAFMSVTQSLMVLSLLALATK